MPDPRRLIEPLLALHDRIRDSVVDACERQAAEELSTVDAEEPSDTIYRVDRVSETILVEGLAEIARTEPLCLVAEGLSERVLVLTEGAAEADCIWRIIVDP